MTSSITASWRASPALQPHIREALEKAVNGFPVDHLKAPAAGELFDSVDDCESRLVAFSLVQGFDIVKIKSSLSNKALTPTVIFGCIFHGRETRNYRRLEPSVIRNEEGTIISQRKRQLTSICKTDCGWRCKISYKSVGKRGTEPKAWILTAPSLEHFGHDLVDNPLIFPRHRERIDAFKNAKRLAITHRYSIIPFSIHRRILESEDIGLTLTAKEYYNSVRNEKLSATNIKSIEGLLVALQEAGFIYRCRVDNEEDKDGIINVRRLEQIWFTHEDLIESASRFMSGSLCIIDATFNTNKARMPLIIAVGVLNTGKTFPVAFSWCRSESHESYLFFWESLKAHLPTTCAPPAVIISDQAPAILSSLTVSFPQSKHQICAWHAVEAMLAAFRRHGHTDLQIKGGRDEAGQEIQSLRDLAWNYIKSSTKNELDYHRKALTDAILRPQYINETWFDKEERIIWFYTRKLPNLGHTSSQRSESYHVVISQALNGQLPLEIAVTRLCQHLKSIRKDIAILEEESKRRYPRITEGSTFIDLRFKITHFALEKVGHEWAILSSLMSQLSPNLGPCECEILLRFRLPCRHYLERAWMTNIPLSRSLIHPRWWIKGPEITFQSWEPIYSINEPEAVPPPQYLPPPSMINHQRITSVREALNPNELYRFDKQREQLQLSTEEQVINLGRTYLELQQIPIYQPNEIPQRSWRRAKPHDKSTKRGMTANEMLAERERRRQQQMQQQDRYQQAQEQRWQEENTIEIIRQRTPDYIPDSPLVPATTPPQQSTSLPIRSPLTPRPRLKRDPSPDLSPEIYYFEPVVSTAPAILGRGKRRRYHTARLDEARQQGLLPGSQERQ
jgi:hypothetical protein